MARACLQPGEEIEEAFTAVSRIPWLILSLPLLPVIFVLELRGASASSWMVAVYVGLVTMWWMRTHHVVLTNRRLLVLKLRLMSSGNVSEEHSLPRNPSVKVLFEKRSPFHVVRIEYGPRRWRLMAPLFHRERVANLIRRAEAWN